MVAFREALRDKSPGAILRQSFLGFSIIMEPLSPRNVNIQSKSKTAMKAEAQAADLKKAALQREKSLAEPPPPFLVQPPVEYGSLSEKYRVGAHLGKGGFAICYEGELQCRTPGKRNKVYALKVVKAKMTQKKMEDKVC